MEIYDSEKRAKSLVRLVNGLIKESFGDDYRGDFRIKEVVFSRSQKKILGITLESGPVRSINRDFYIGKINKRFMRRNTYFFVGCFPKGEKFSGIIVYPEFKEHAEKYARLFEDATKKDSKIYIYRKGHILSLTSTPGIKSVEIPDNLPLRS